MNGKFLSEGWKKSLWLKEGVELFLSEKMNFFFEFPIWVGSSLMSLGHLAAQSEGGNDFRVWNGRHGLKVCEDLGAGVALFWCLECGD